MWFVESTRAQSHFDLSAPLQWRCSLVKTSLHTVRACIKVRFHNICLSQCTWRMWQKWCNLTYSRRLGVVIVEFVIFIVLYSLRMSWWFSILPWACVHKCCSWSCSVPSSASTLSGWVRDLQAGWCCSGWQWDWRLHRRLRVGGAPCWGTAPSHSPVIQGTSHRR